jgi:hypothetical protein
MAMVDVSLSAFSTDDLIKELESRQQHMHPFVVEKVKANMQCILDMKRQGKQNTEEFDRRLNILLYDTLGRAT